MPKSNKYNRAAKSIKSSFGGDKKTDSEDWFQKLKDLLGPGLGETVTKKTKKIKRGK